MATGETAGYEDGCIESTPFDRQAVATFDEGGEVFIPIDGIAPEHPTKKHDLLGDERPHTHVGSFVLLFEVIEMVLERTAMSVGRHQSSGRPPLSPPQPLFQRG